MAFQVMPTSAAPEDVAASPFCTAVRAPCTSEVDAREPDHSRRSDSISVIKLDGPETAVVNTVEEMDTKPRQKSDTPTLAGDHTGVYWHTPAKMISGLFFGLTFAILHHVYYMTRDGANVPNAVDQQWTLRAGTVFAFLVTTCLISSARNAYTQWLWLRLKNKNVSIKALDAAFQADLSPHAVLNREMLWKMPVGALIAIIALSIPIASLITPTTLSVRQGNFFSNVTGYVNVLDMSSFDPSRNISQPGRFAVWATQDPDDGYNVSAILTGPRTIISRYSDAAASSGNVLVDIPQYQNSTWTSHFHGPIVQCEAATALEAKIIDELIDAQMAASQAAEMNQEMNYFAFVPVKNSSTAASNITSPFPGYNISVILGDRSQEPVNATNQLWMAYSKYADGSSCSNALSIVRQHTVCSLWNASYLVNFTYENGIQDITIANLDLLNKVDYPNNDQMTPSDLTQYAYSAYMWAFTNQIIGFMRLYQEKLSNGTGGLYYSPIQSAIEDTVLLGSSDLDVFFDRRHLQLEGQPKCNLSDQRLQDIGLAHNESLDILIPELSSNITLSFFSSSLLSPSVATNITTKSIVNFYAYNSRDLLISYALAIAFALLANILGAAAFWRNRVSHDRSFSALLSSTRDPQLASIFESPRLGKLPLPENVAHTLLRFEEDVVRGGWSLKLAAGEREGDRVRDGCAGEGSGWRVALGRGRWRWVWAWAWGSQRPGPHAPPHWPPHLPPHSSDANETAKMLLER